METPPIENPENPPAKPANTSEPILVTGAMVVNLIAIGLNALAFIGLTWLRYRLPPNGEYAVGNLLGKLWFFVLICSGIAIYHWFKGPENSKRQAKIAMIAGFVNLVEVFILFLFAL